MVTVFLVDDHEVVRRGLIELLRTDPELDVVGEAGSVSEAMARIPAVRPDVAVLDVRLPDGNGIELCRELLSSMPDLRSSEAATAWAFDEASRLGVGLVALHAWSDVGVFPILGMDWHAYRDQGDEVLAERLAGWQEQYPDVPVRRRLLCDTPVRWLLQESERAQMVVVGRNGRGGLGGMFLGSVSSAVAQSTKVPVVVVRNRVAQQLSGPAG